MIQRFQRWRARRKADRELIRQNERFMRAFLDGDQEVVRAEIMRRNGKFIMAVIRMNELQREMYKHLEAGE